MVTSVLRVLLYIELSLVENGRFNHRPSFSELQETVQHMFLPKTKANIRLPRNSKDLGGEPC